MASKTLLDLQHATNYSTIISTHIISWSVIDAVCVSHNEHTSKHIAFCKSNSVFEALCEAVCYTKCEFGAEYGSIIVSFSVHESVFEAIFDTISQCVSKLYANNEANNISWSVFEVFSTISTCLLR